MTLDHLKIRAGVKLALPHPVGPLSVTATPGRRELGGGEGGAQKKTHAQERHEEESLETFG